MSANTNLFDKSRQGPYLPSRAQYPRRIANLPSYMQIVHLKLADVGKCFFFLILTDRFAEQRLVLRTTTCLPN